MKMHQIVCSLVVTSALFAVTTPASAQVCGTPRASTLFAGQTIVAGTVTIFNDASNIYVQYQANFPWVISDAHAAVAATLDGIPQTKTGNPIPGRFAYSATFDPEVTTYTFGVPFSAVFTAGQTVFVAAHAMLQAPKNDGGSQTGWAFGPDFSGANWATYVAYQVQRCGRAE
jgi:hypothetical protein